MASTPVTLNPRGLKADEISLETRIITTADIFDAIASALDKVRAEISAVLAWAARLAAAEKPAQTTPPRPS